MPNRSRLAKLRLLRRLRKSRSNGQVSTREETAAPSENENLQVDPLENTALDQAVAPDNHTAPDTNIALEETAASTRTRPRRRWTRLAKSRAVRWLAPLTIFAIFALWLAGVVRQRVDIDAIVRRTVLPEIEKRVGAPVEVGRIESDLSHVTLTDVVVGRDAKLPTGALLRAKTIRLDADLLAIALRRVSDPLAALRAVTVTAPQLYLRRDARGVFNWAKVFQTPSQSAASGWQGHVEIVDGRIYYLDETLRAAPQSRINGAPLRVDARGINGAADFAKDGGIAFSAALASTRFPLYGQRIGVLQISGESGTAPAASTPAATGQNTSRWISADATFPALPAFVFTDYAFHGGQIVTRAGTLAGKLQVAFDGAAPPASRLLFAGDLALSGIDGRSKLLKVPGTNALQFAALSGPLRFRGTAFSSTGIAVRALGTPLRLAGSFALPASENPAPQLAASTRATSKSNSQSARDLSDRDTEKTASNAAQKSADESFRIALSDAQNRARVLKEAARDDEIANSPDASTRAPSRPAVQTRDTKSTAQKRGATTDENATAILPNAAARLKDASTRALQNAARDVAKNRDNRETRRTAKPQKTISQPAIFSISASSNDVQMARVLPLLRAIPALRGVRVEAVRGALQLQVSGDTTAFSTTARLQLPAFALRDARYGTLRGASLFADLKLNRNGRGTLALKTSQATFGSAQTLGAVRAPRGFASDLNASLNFGEGASPMVRFDVSDLRGQALAATSNAVFRAGETLQLRASQARGFATFATDGTLRGGALTSGEVRASSSRARVLATGFAAELAPFGGSTGAKNYALNFNASRLETSGALLPKARGGAISASLKARGVRVAATLGRENSAAFSSESFAASGYGENGFRAAGSALRGAVRQSDSGYFSADFSAPSLRLMSGNAPILPSALRGLKMNGAAWNGALRIANAPNATRAAQRVFFASTRTANLNSARYGALRAAALQLTFVQNGAAQRAALQLKHFAARPGMDWPEQARRALGNRALRGDAMKIDASNQGAASSWRGVLSLQKINAASLDLKTISAQIAEHASDFGTLSGRADFSLDARGGALNSGNFALSKVTVEGEKLRDVRGFVALRNGALQLRGLRAQTESGDLGAQADYDFKSGALSLALDAPRLALDVARLNPYLAAQGVALGGRAIGKMNVSSVGGARIGAPLRVEFDVTVPRGAVRSITSTRNAPQAAHFAAPARDALALKNLRLRGNGIWRGGARGWNFSGETEVFAERTSLAGGVARLGAVTLPDWIGGARARNFHAKVRGEIAGATSGKSAPLLIAKNNATTSLVPAAPRDFSARASANRSASTRGASTLRARLSGSVFVENLAAPLPRTSSSTRATDVELANARADFSLVENVLRVPRFAARVPQLAARAAIFSAASQRSGASLSPSVSAANAGRIGGSFLRRADGTLGGQIALDAFDARAVQSLAAQVSPTFSMDGAQIVRGAAFARVALAGTLAAPRARVQMQLLDAGVRTATAGVPIDLLRLQTTLPPRANGVLSLDEATLWSGGGRLSLRGEVGRVREYSRGPETFALNLEARADGLPMARLAATPQLQKLRRDLELDGLVSGDAHIGGTLSLPRVEGRAALRLAQIAGVGVAEMTTPLFYHATPRGVVLKLAAVTARIEQANISGALTVDAPAGVWNADLKIDDAPTSRLLRAAADAADLLARRDNAVLASEIATSQSAAAPSDLTRVAKQLRALQDVPLRADLRAELSLRGTAGITKIAKIAERDAAPREYSQFSKSALKLHKNIAVPDARASLRGNANGDFGVTEIASKNRGNGARPNDATREYSGAISPAALWPPLTLESASLQLASDDVKWRGRTLGELRGTLSLQDDIARTDLALLRKKPLPVSARQYSPAPFLDAAFTKNLSAQGEDAARDVIAKVSGEVPLRAGESDSAPPLDVTARIEDEEFSLVRDALVETQNALRERGFHYANFDAAMLRLRALPRDMQVDVSVQARLVGTLRNPALVVDMIADNARRGAQTLPSLQAAFNFDDGTIGVRGLELRQPYQDKTREYSRLISGAAPSVSSAEKTAEETAASGRTTVVRLAEGGRIAPTGDIELDGEVLNANLSQLAAWIPELRQVDGAPLLRGEVSLFSFQVRGTMQAPRVAGSVEARDLLYRAYTLDRLRVSRFDIADGRFSIAPGNLTVVKGKFQSSAPWGYVPWTWGDESSAPGPRRDAMLEVHFPLQSRDFGALAGTFVPALQNAEAEDFSGTVTLTGSLDAPQISGEAALANARFRADPALLPVAFGIEGLSGKVRFENGNRLEIDDVRGRLVEAGQVRAASTNNLPAAERDARAARRAARRTDVEKPPHLAGAFSLGGNVQLDLDSRNFAAPGQSLSAHRYDLKLALQNGEYSTAQFSGLKNVALDVVLQTAAGAPRTSQNLFWTLNANGVSGDRKSRNTKGGAARDGLLVSTASVVLAPDFASGANAFFRSRFRGRVLMRALPFAVKDVAMGQLDGLLQLDNEAPSAGRRPFELPPTLAALQSELKAPRAEKTVAQIAPPLSLTTRASGLQQPFVSPRDVAPMPGNAPASTRDGAAEIIADDPRRLAMRGVSNKVPATFSTNRDNARAGSRNGIEARADESVANAALSADASTRAAPLFGAPQMNDANMDEIGAGKPASELAARLAARGASAFADAKKSSASAQADAPAEGGLAASSLAGKTSATAEIASSEISAAPARDKKLPSLPPAKTPSTFSKLVAPKSEARATVASNETKSSPHDAPLYSQSKPGAKTIGEQLAPHEIAPLVSDENSREYSQETNANGANADAANATDANATNAQSGNAKDGAPENDAPQNSEVFGENAPSSAVPLSTEVARVTQKIAQSVTAHQAQSREYSRALQEKLAQETVATSPLKIAPANELKTLAESDFGAPLRVSGQVEMSQTEISGAPIGTAGVGGVLPDAPRFDVALLIGREVRFVTPTLRAQFTGTLDVGGTPHDPFIVGTLSTRDGQIRFPNATARLTEGEVSVNITRDPVADAIRSRVEIDASATGRAGAYNITLAVRGPLDFGSENEQNLRVDVSSDPPLAKDEAFALLTGTSLRELESQNGGVVRAEDANRVYARAVVSLLASPLFAGIERTLEEALGLSSITLDYRFEEPLSVQFGKAVGDRVYVTYRRSVGPAFSGARTPYTLRVEYRIKGGLQLGVQTDETGRNQLTLNKTFRF